MRSMSGLPVRHQQLNSMMLVSTQTSLHAPSPSPPKIYPLKWILWKKKNKTTFCPQDF